MPAPFSGGFARSQRFMADKLEPLHIANPRHFYSGHEQETPYVYNAPPAEALGEGSSSTWGSESVISSDGGLLDHTPIDHQEGLSAPVHYTDMADLTDPGGAEKDLLRDTMPQHAKDQGAVRALNQARPHPLQFRHEVYGGQRIEGFGPEASEVTEVALRRGLNADEQNNPPDESYLGRGFRYGWIEQSYVDRKLVGQGLNPRSHDARWYQPNTAWADTNAPPPAKGNPYTNPFPTLARGIQILAQRPQLRRSPNPEELINSPLEQTGLQEPYAADSSWFGG